MEGIETIQRVRRIPRAGSGEITLLPFKFRGIDSYCIANYQNGGTRRTSWSLERPIIIYPSKENVPYFVLDNKESIQRSVNSRKVELRDASFGQERIARTLEETERFAVYANWVRTLDSNNPLFRPFENLNIALLEYRGNPFLMDQSYSGRLHNHGIPAFLRGFLSDRIARKTKRID